MTIAQIAAGAIVVGHDGSAASLAAVRHAAALARRWGRTLVVVHAVEAGVSGYPDVPVPELDRVMAQVRKEAAEAVEEVAAELRAEHAGLAVEPVVVTQDARAALLAASEVAHTVVVGSRGRGPIARLLLGSVSTAVVRHASCPVLVHRMQQGGGSAGIVVGVDGTASSRPVLEAAYAEAETLGLPVTALYSYLDVVASWEAAYVEGKEQPDLEPGRAGVAQMVAGLAEDHPGVELRTELLQGLPRPANQLAKLSAEAALVVVGHHDSGVFDRLLAGSVAIAVAERAVCPVLVVPVGPRSS